MSKYNATRVWACHACCRPAERPTSRRKGSRDCPYCSGPPTIVCFASKAEFKRWCDLRMLERVNTIRNLEYQPSFRLIVNGKDLGKYTADARYFEGNECVVLEVKGMETREARLRRRLAEAIYRINVTVVK